MPDMCWAAYGVRWCTLLAVLLMVHLQAPRWLMLVDPPSVVLVSYVVMLTRDAKNNYM